MSTLRTRLHRTPFRGMRTVYAGPQQLALAGGLKRALAAPDAVITITGAVGTGKTVSAMHALERRGLSQAVARIGRICLQRDELLELLLDQFRVSETPASSLQRFAAYKRMLCSWSGAGTRVTVVVEDAERLGADVLAELESLTAADSDDMPGANLVLLGNEELGRFLEQPLLARLRQRIRRNFRVEPFSREETRNYLGHRLCEAGGDLGGIFDEGAIDVIYRSSEGVARMINSLAETMLVAAEETGCERVDAELARRVAREDFGMSDIPASTADVASRAASPEPPAPVAKPPVAEPPVTESPIEEADAAAMHEYVDDAGMPGRIQDTQPSIRSLAQPTADRDRARLAAAAGSAIPRPGGEPDGFPGETSIPLEPPAPEGLSTNANPADTQTVRALDDALRPDTQLLKTLDVPLRLVEDDAPVPPGLREPEPADEPAPEPARNDNQKPANTAANEADDDSAELPTLSETVTMKALSARDIPGNVLPPGPATPGAADESASKADEAAPDGATTIAARTAERPLAAVDPIAGSGAPEPPSSGGSAGSEPQEEAVLAAKSGESRRASMNDAPTVDAGTSRQSAGPELSLEATGASNRTVPSTAGAVGAEPDPDGRDARAADRDDLPDLSLVPEITLDVSLQEHQQEAQARLAEEAAGIAASDQDEPDDEVSADAAPRDAMPEAVETETSEEAAREDDARRKRLESLAERFSEAKSIEDIVDDTAAETLFGEEFSQIVAAVTAMHEAQQENAADSGSLETASNDAGAQDRTPQKITAPQPRTRRPAGPPPAVDIDSSAARRLEMVRALNRNAGRPAPEVPEVAGEEIVLGGSEESPGCSGLKPEPIENQFGESMTAKLRALNAENIRDMQEAAEQQQSRGGFLSRFKRS